VSATATVAELRPEPRTCGSYDPHGAPTVEQYGAFEAAFQHFNGRLFDGGLPLVMLAFAKHGKSLGYFAPRKWRAATAGGTEGTVGEIALNPDHLARNERATAATIVHEMVHLWQHVTPSCKPGRRGYHNSEWASKMETLGLMPSSTGAPGGIRVGQRMTHYVVDNGPFDRAFERLAKAALLPFLAGVPPHDGPGVAKSTSSAASKTKYSCTKCRLNAWARPNADLMHCGQVMQVVGEASRGVA
jgi:predicted SprT family Zn-dependent metalloprotease